MPPGVAGTSRFGLWEGSMMTVPKRPGTAPDIVIGVVGAEHFIYRVVEVAQQGPDTGYRLATAAYERESDAQSAAARIADDVDVLLFAGPLPYDRATSTGEINVPAMYVPTGGATFPISLLRIAHQGLFDITRISIDSVSRREAEETYSELNLSMNSVRVRPYQPEESAQSFAEFHEEHFRSGLTTGAITTVPTVSMKLAELGLPHLLMEPVPLTLRNSLRTARLLGSDARTEDSQIAVVLIRLPSSTLPHRESSSNLWFQELQLNLHKLLLREARRMGAVVLRRDERSHMIYTTLGSLRSATEDLSRAPFLQACAVELAVTPEVGIGLGRTPAEALAHAERAIDLSAARSGEFAYLVPSPDVTMALPTQTAANVPEVTRHSDTHHVILNRILGTLSPEEAASRIVDAEKVARSQGVTLRTARRQLHTLVDSGLAWRMPPARDQKVGRPRIQFQLLEAPDPDKEPITAAINHN